MDWVLRFLSFLRGTALSDMALLRPEGGRDEEVLRSDGLPRCSSCVAKPKRRGTRTEEEYCKVIKLLKGLRRLSDPTRAEMFRYIREITDAILKASLK